VVLGLVFGVLRGLSIVIWKKPDGSTWTRGTWITMALWSAMIAIRIATGALDQVLGLDTKAMTGELMVFVLLTFGAQSAVIWVRSQLPAPGTAPSGAL